MVGRSGDQVVRWSGGQVVRWSGGQVVRVVRGAHLAGQGGADAMVCKRELHQILSKAQFMYLFQNPLNIPMYIIL